MCVCVVCLSVCEYEYIQKKVLDALKLELQVAVKNNIWVIRILFNF